MKRIAILAALLLSACAPDVEALASDVASELERRRQSGDAPTIGPMDTSQSRSAILALLADNAAGDISPLDLRDAVVSGACYAGISLTDDGVTTLAMSATPAHITLFNTNLPDECATSDVASDEIDLPNFAADWHVSFTISFETSASAEYTFHGTKNAGTELGNGCAITRNVSSGGAGGVGAASFDCIITAAANDTIEVYGEVASGTPNLVIHHAALKVERADL